MYFIECLVDRGANCGIGGEGLRHISNSFPLRHVDVQQVFGGSQSNIKIGNFGGVAESEHGQNVILIFHDYAVLTKANRTVHSSIQLEHGGNIVDDRHPTHGGSLTMTTSNGIVFPLSFRQGLTYLRLRPFTDNEWETLPRVPVTRPNPWDPSIYDTSTTSHHGLLDNATTHTRQVNAINAEPSHGERGHNVIDIMFWHQGTEQGNIQPLREQYNVDNDRSIITTGYACNRGIAGSSMILIRCNMPAEYVDIVDDKNKFIYQARVGCWIFCMCGDHYNGEGGTNGLP